MPAAASPAALFDAAFAAGALPARAWATGGDSSCGIRASWGNDACNQEAGVVFQVMSV